MIHIESFPTPFAGNTTCAVATCSAPVTTTVLVDLGCSFATSRWCALHWVELDLPKIQALLNRPAPAPLLAVTA